MLDIIRGVRDSVGPMVELLHDEMSYSDTAAAIMGRVRYGLVLAESDLPLATIALILLRQAERELWATEPGKRLSLAWHVLQGRPLAYRVVVDGQIMLDADTKLVDITPVREGVAA